MTSYRDLGVRPLINAAGTFTKYSGSLIYPEVLKAMEEASRSFVDVEELLEKSGQYLAEIIGVEAVLVTAGAAAGLAQAAAACIGGRDPDRIRALPEAVGMRNEIVVMRCHRNPYDQAMRGVGARFVEIGNALETHPWELDAAIGDRTAAVAFFVQSEMFESSLPLVQILEITHGREVPVIVDAAAELPPVTNLTKFARMGADVVLFSGGKDLRGPQSSGLLLGRRELVETCRLHGPPRHNIGRSMKVDKETIMGLVRAVELYLKEDHDARMKTWEAQTMKFAEAFESVPHVTVSTGTPSQPYCMPSVIPRAFVRFDEEAIGKSLDDIVKELFEGTPAIATATYNRSLAINPHMLQKGEEDIVIERIKDII